MARIWRHVYTPRVSCKHWLKLFLLLWNFGHYFVEYPLNFWTYLFVYTGSDFLRLVLLVNLLCFGFVWPITDWVVQTLVFVTIQYGHFADQEYLRIHSHLVLLCLYEKISHLFRLCFNRETFFDKTIFLI